MISFLILCADSAVIFLKFALEYYCDFMCIIFYYYCYYCIGLSRYIAITNLSIIAVFVEYLRQFLIDLNQTYRHSSVPQNTSP